VHRSRDEKFAWTVCDPSMYAQSGGPPIAERLFKFPGFGLVKAGDNKRVARTGSSSKAGAMGGWDAMRARIRGDGETPMLFVFSTCRDFIRTIPALTHDPHRAEDVDTDSEDHIADECRYACMSRIWTAKVSDIRTAGFRPDGSPITTHKRSWKVLAEMSYDELAKATGHTLDRRERHRERV
jgi:hypothetical protein